MDIVGIYSITNMKNNKIYIGQSLDIKRRWSEHIEDLNGNNHHSFKLQNDWNKYGKDEFIFKIEYELEDIHKSKSLITIELFLIWKENKYILEHGSIVNGYNIQDTMNEIIIGNKVINGWGDGRYYLKKIISTNGGIFYEQNKQSKSRKRKYNPLQYEEALNYTISEFHKFTQLYCRLNDVANNLTFINKRRFFALLCESKVINKTENGYLPVKDSSDFIAEMSVHLDSNWWVTSVKKEYIFNFVKTNFEEIVSYDKLKKQKL